MRPPAPRPNPRQSIWYQSTPALTSGVIAEKPISMTSLIDGSSAMARARSAALAIVPPSSIARSSVQRRFRQSPVGCGVQRVIADFGSVLQMGQAGRCAALLRRGSFPRGLARCRRTDARRAFDPPASARPPRNDTVMLNGFRWPFTPSALFCSLFGHDDSLAREPTRLFLRCDVCGRQTRGWTIGPPPGTAERPTTSRKTTARRQPPLRIVRPAV